MLRFVKYEGSRGIPIYYEQLPKEVRSSALSLVVFAGAADDTSVGQQGIYHWFEHVPFRGTKNFPGGYNETKGTISNIGGNSGARTNMYQTSYWAHVPTRSIETAIDVVVDLVAEPLLTEKGIIAERTIIHQEISDKLSNAQGKFSYTCPSLLWPNHPLGGSVLGSADSLDSMTPELLWVARKQGYDVSRMAFFVSTSLSIYEVDKMLRLSFRALPEYGLSERRQNPSFGSLTWTPEKRIEIPTEQETSILEMMFPNFQEVTWQTSATQSMLQGVIQNGNLGSPLYKAVREDTQLAYSANFGRANGPDGSYFNFSVNTSAQNLAQVEEALRVTLFRDPRLRSREWFDTIKSSRRDKLDMEIIHPMGEVNLAVAEIGRLGSTLSSSEFIDLLDKVSHDEVVAMIDDLAQAEPHIVIALGK